MPVGIIGRMGPGMGQVVPFVDRLTGKGYFCGRTWGRNCNQWRLTFAATRPSFQISLGRLVITVSAGIHWPMWTKQCLTNLTVEQFYCYKTSIAVSDA